MNWKRISVGLLGLLFLALLTLNVPTSSAVESPQLSSGLRTIDWTLESYDYLSPSGTDTTVGTDGIVASATFGTTISFTDTSTSISQPPYPAKLHINFKYTGATSATGCSTVKIWGEDQFGTAITESYTGSPGTAFTATTTYVYGKLSRFYATGCGSTVAATTRPLRISLTKYVGLPAKIKSYKNIIAVCQRDDTDADPWDCVAGNRMDDLSVSAIYNWIDVEAPSGTDYTISDGDFIKIRLRGSNY